MCPVGSNWQYIVVSNDAAQKLRQDLARYHDIASVKIVTKEKPKVSILLIIQSQWSIIGTDLSAGPVCIWYQNKVISVSADLLAPRNSQAICMYTHDYRDKYGLQSAFGL